MRWLVIREGDWPTKCVCHRAPQRERMLPVYQPGLIETEEAGMRLGKNEESDVTAAHPSTPMGGGAP